MLHNLVRTTIFGVTQSAAPLGVSEIVNDLTQLGYAPLVSPIVLIHRVVLLM